MSLDQLQSLNNVNKSIKKFIVDGMMSDLSDVKFLFSFALHNTPLLNGEEAVQWVGVNFTSLRVQGYLARTYIEFDLYSRNDPEYLKLLRLSDSITGYFFDYTQIDPSKRIPLYDTDTQPWVVIGYMISDVQHNGQVLMLSDETAFKSIRVDLKWAVK